MRLAERLKSYVGQPIAILCARYWYRGILSDVGDEHVLITNPRAVEVTGAATAENAEREDVIPSDLLLRLDFVEIVCWPTWCYAGMDAESLKKAEEAKAKASDDRKNGKKPAAPATPARARR